MYLRVSADCSQVVDVLKEPFAALYTGELVAAHAGTATDISLSPTSARRTRASTGTAAQRARLAMILLQPPTGRLLLASSIAALRLSAT